MAVNPLTLCPCSTVVGHARARVGSTRSVLLEWARAGFITGAVAGGSIGACLLLALVIPGSTLFELLVAPLLGFVIGATLGLALGWVLGASVGCALVVLLGLGCLPHGRARTVAVQCVALITSAGLLATIAAILGGDAISVSDSPLVGLILIPTGIAALLLPLRLPPVR